MQGKERLSDIDHVVNPRYNENDIDHVVNQLSGKVNLVAEQQNGSIPEDKKQAIMDIALEHFAEQGYEKASTNRMIRQAGISKGILFHYFSSKKNLYVTVLDHCLNHLDSFMKEEQAKLPADLFKRIMLISKMKMRFFLQYPLMYKLIVEAFSSQALGELSEEIGKRGMMIASLTSVAFDDVDTSAFREGIDPSRAFDLVVTAVNALSHRFMAEHYASPSRGLDQLERYTDELRLYLEMLQTGIYGNGTNPGKGGASS